jgi:hypothetical protein
MKQALQILFLFVADLLFSQSISQISSAETMTFVAATSGCFNAGTNTYRFIRQKNGERKVDCTIDKVNSAKKISAKNYEAFVKRYQESAKRFSDPDEKQMCTTTAEFEMSSKKGNSKFRNITCEPQFDPETYLKQLLK